MNIQDRITLVGGVVLIGLGVLFLVLNTVLGLTVATTWPIIFFVLAAGFYLPPLVLPYARQALAALFIPGSVMLALGLIFFYDTLTSDWASWAYAWLLIPAGVGLGLALASWVGGWGKDPAVVGLWMLAVSAAIFCIFGTLFGGPVLKAITPVLLILVGILILLRAFLRRPTRTI